jgi:hypothetical protein
MKGESEHQGHGGRGRSKGRRRGKRERERERERKGNRALSTYDDRGGIAAGKYLYIVTKNHVSFIAL